MSEPRKLNTDDARTVYHAAAPRLNNGAQGAARSVHTGQAAGGAPSAAPGYGGYAANAQGYGYRAPYPAQYAPQRPYPAASGAAAPAAGRAGAADAYEQARRNAQAAADQTTRLRRIQQGARPRSTTGELTPAQRQAIAMRSARQQNAAAAFQSARPAQAPQQAAMPAAAPRPAAGYAVPAAAQHANAAPATGAAQARPRPAAGAMAAGRAPQAAPAAQPAQAALADRTAKARPEPPRSAPKSSTPKSSDRKSSAKAAPKAGPAKARKEGAGKSNAGKGGKGGKGGKNPPPKGKKGKKKMRWWQVALITVLLIALILGGALALIMHAIAPSAGGLSLDKMFNTPKEFQGKELNFLMIGIDRVEQSDWSSGDRDVGDGNTDMILYVHFNNETGEMKMLQIPRDYFVGPDRSISNNYRLNNVAKTQGSGRDDEDKWNMPALCEQVSNMFQLPIDGYISIHMEMLNQLVDAFGYIELYVPQDLEYNGSRLEKGYRLLNAQQVEFLLRDRHSYADSDIGRLNTQRQFYSALFRRLKTMTMWEVAKVTPAVLQFMETDLSIGQLTSFAVSMLKIDSSKIMICQMPVYMGLSEYNGQSVVYPARQQAADLLNQYFRENTGPIDASQLQLADNVVSTAGCSATDPNIQFLKAINDQQADAAINDNPDGIYTIDYVDPDTPEDPQPAGEGDAASQPAA